MKTLKMLEILLALSIIPLLVMPAITIKPANAVPITIPPTNPDPQVNPIVWDLPPGGTAVYDTLLWNPEFLLAHADTIIDSDTTIHIQGLDQYGANIEAKVFWPKGTKAQNETLFTDPHSGEPVAFTKITAINQQNGTHCNHIEIKTAPLGWEQYLGTYENSTGYWEPTYQYVTHLSPIGGPYGPIYTQDVPVQPVNPEPIKILINWYDAYGALQPVFPPGFGPEWTQPGSKNDTKIWIEGLDQNGTKLIVQVNIPVGARWVSVNTLTSDIGLHTFSDICKVWGGYGSGDSYYIFTEPMGERNLFEYYIRIHHLALYPATYDILANPAVDPFDPTNYPGVTNITLVLLDMDNHLVHAPAAFDNWPGTNTPQPIIINWWTSGGEIRPSYSQIAPGGVSVTVNLTADTNARTIKVVADANIPTHNPTGLLPSPKQNIQAWTELTFDGINSVLDTSAWPIHVLQAGYTTMDGIEHWFNAPPEPPLADWLGGPIADSLVPLFKLNGPIYEVAIQIYPGCNLISSPVYPIFGTKGDYYSPAYGGLGIPMSLLFGNTSATETLEAIWWYEATGGPTGIWHVYIPGVTTGLDDRFVDGVGYWIKAEKPCTLEISGVEMENAPFVPAEYPVYHSWNLMGFTSTVARLTADYLESLNTGYITPGEPVTLQSAVGPIWAYNAQFQVWVRNPLYLYPTNGFWMNYKLAGIADLAP